VRPQATSAAVPPKTPPRPGPLDAGVEAGSALAAADAGATIAPALRTARDVDAIFVGHKTFSARFEQQYTQKVMGTVKKSTGVVFVERPNKISFRYDPPSLNRIVADGTEIKVYVADDHQMFVTPADKTQYPGALAFMMGNGIASSFDFTIAQAPSAQAPSAQAYAGTILQGKPLVANPSYETVLFYVSPTALAAHDPGVIERVLIVDAQGNRNRFDFKNATQPASIPASEFTFTPPPGTTITR
jgi:outer membrane lipoprotein carrier protein